jgi:hypothetical protein
MVKINTINDLQNKYCFNLEEVEKIKLPDVVKNNNHEYPGYPSLSHYKLLSFFAQKFNDIDIINISHDYLSEYSFSTNLNNRIYTFNSNNYLLNEDIKNLKLTSRIDLTDSFERENWKILILKSKLIFFDLTVHDGIKEYEFFLFLKENNYQGIFIVNHIWNFKTMRDNFWYKIPSFMKWDLTDLGHSFGTGIILFDQKEEEKIEEKNWTFVTGYFDITKYEDASKQIKDRPPNFYLHSCNTTLSVNANLVIFTEEKFKPILEKLRPDHLKNNTKFIICNFEDFHLYKYRNKIAENRKKNLIADPRNTVSYYLCCMTRYSMVKQVTELNPFNSTHFGWIDFGIERQGFKNASSLDNVIHLYRDKVSACYINYIPQKTVDNLKEYFQWGRCAIASGFFTGNLKNIQKFCRLVELQFITYVELGFGHADEQLFSPIYFSNPDLFHFYFGDYRSIITNYCQIREDIDSIFLHFIQNTYNNKNYYLCSLACKALWDYFFKFKSSNTKLLKEKQKNYLDIFLDCCSNIQDLNFSKEIINEYLTI